MPVTNRLAAVLLAVVSAAHLLRLVLGVQVTVADKYIPKWVSAIAVVVAGGLSILLWIGGRRR